MKKLFLALACFAPLLAAAEDVEYYDLVTAPVDEGVAAVSHAILIIAGLIAVVFVAQSAYVLIMGMIKR